jgi:hypothetical protein
MIDPTAHLPEREFGFEPERRLLGQRVCANARNEQKRQGALSVRHLPSHTRLELKGRTWVTRKGLHVDRIACSWLIRRFIDPDAVIRFVPGKGYLPKPGELRFDMFEGDITHEGDRCSFEVLLARAGISDPALQAIAEIVHDIDLKDAKFGREEAPGIASLIGGIAATTTDDEQRLVQGAPVFDKHFRRKRR